ncbi:hypothetical protein SAMN05192554_12430 [Haloarchaeobius iranensis]|uniref:E2 family protein E n=1 Tax=Haloarchaeobius iranensis TaxID=996166 RepID=A0A1H0A3E6_9EURY|nr:hypothetical protein SAMN05192554_12430 [Haloarchaeobius iranensis]
MTSGRVLADIAELASVLRERSNTQLTYDVQDSSFVEIGHFRFPDGWQTTDGTRVGAIRFELPASYPNMPPSVAVPAGMRYQGQRTQAMQPTRAWPPENWVAFEPDYGQWNPAADGLLTALAAIERRLRDPQPKTL